MTRSSRVSSALALLMCCAIGVADGQAPAGQDRVPILAELFTAEGCSSCPPADKILEWLSKEQPVDGVFVVAMSEHVTYWDHQGWKDPFGSPRFTERQQMYAKRLGVADIFTPQLVIDGTVQMIGSDTAALKRALADAARRPKPPLIVTASLTANDEVTGSASGPGLEAGAIEGADLVWALTEDDLAVDVSRGENARRTLHHSGVVRVLSGKKIARGTAAPLTIVMRVPSGARPGNLRLVAFVQSPKSKRVVSVGSTRVIAE